MSITVSVVATAESTVADAEQDEHDDEQPLLAVDVPEPADQRCRDRRAEQIRGQHPADGVDRGVQRVLELWQRGRDERLQQGIADARRRRAARR